MHALTVNCTPAHALADPRKELIPTPIFLEALLAAFQHMGVQFDKDSEGTNMRITQDDSIIPMIPAGIFVR